MIKVKKRNSLNNRILKMAAQVRLVWWLLTVTSTVQLIETEIAVDSGTTSWN